MDKFTLSHLKQLEAGLTQEPDYVLKQAKIIQDWVQNGVDIEPGAREVLDRLLAADATSFVPSGPLGGTASPPEGRR